MSASHPLAPVILPYCQRYPQQAPSLFQSFLDLNLAQAWQDITVVDLDECNCVVLHGKPKPTAPSAFVLPMSLTAPTSLAEFASIFAALDKRFPSSPTPPTSSTPSAEPPSSTESATPSSVTAPAEADAPTLYLSIVEKDSSVVYYVLRRGIVSPKEVPE